MKKYPRPIREKFVTRNRRRNPMLCKYPGCEQRSTHTITWEFSIFRGDDECIPTCMDHIDKLCDWDLAREVLK